MSERPTQPTLYPAFLRLSGKRVLVVGGGQVAESKIAALLEAGADVTVVAPDVRASLIQDTRIVIHRRAFVPEDLDGVWFCVSAAPAEVNRTVALAAQSRECFVNAVDDPKSGSVFLGGVIRRGGTTVSVSTDGAAPALAGLLREALEAVLPEELGRWVETARALRPEWKALGVPMTERRPLLLEALNRLYAGRLADDGATASAVTRVGSTASPVTSVGSTALPATSVGTTASPVTGMGSATSPSTSLEPTNAASPNSSPVALALSGPASTPAAFTESALPRNSKHATTERARSSAGFVWLVGAGPGDPELITLKAARVLAQADLVLYDALVSPEILALAPRAHRFFVGKRAKKKSMKQETIHKLLVRAARRGKNVVRLKCGDPFVFGRGGEEALALHHAGIGFEVIPGVSSAIAAPALAGIPVTHRGLSNSFTLVSGHSPDAYRPALAGLPANAVTLVVLMGKGGRAELADYLVSLGWNRDTPSALLLAASTPRAYTWTGSLHQLGSAQLPEGLEDAPGTVCIGEVVQLAQTLGAPLGDPRSLEEMSRHGSR